MSKKSFNKGLIRAPLSNESVIVAAVKIADVGGIESLSMRKLGESLGVEGMALYHHFANKEALIDGMVDSIHAEIYVPAEGQEWKVAMRQRAMSALRVLSCHTWAAPIIESRHNTGPASMNLINSTIKCLFEAGFSVDMVAHILSILDAYTFGFAQQLRSPTESVEKESEMGKDIIAQFPSDLYPYVGQFVTEHVSKAGYRTMDEFVYGLDLILDGVSRFETKK